jgi:hypothetical protein
LIPGPGVLALESSIDPRAAAGAIITGDLSSELLAACVRYSVGAGTPLEVAEAARRFDDWSGLLIAAEKHGLLPRMAGCFDACDVGAPDQILSTLELAFRENAKRVFVMSVELTRICQRLEAENIPALAIKGPVTAHTLYDDPAYRVFCDLDIFVPREHLTDARKILSDCGYQPSGASRIGIARFTELSLENAANGIHIDLHWELTPPDWYVSMPDGMWERTRRVAILGCEVQTLGEEDTFLHLCIHGAKHGWSSFNWLVDLCSLTGRSPGIVGRSLALLDPKSRAIPMVWFGLAAVAVLLPNQAASSRINIPHHLRALAQKTVRNTLSGAMRDETVFTRLAFQWSIGGNRLAICRFIFRRLFIPNQDDWSTLPIRHRRLLFLLVPWRLVRRTWEVISTAARA